MQLNYTLAMQYYLLTVAKLTCAWPKLVRIFKWCEEQAMIHSIYSPSLIGLLQGLCKQICEAEVILLTTTQFFIH